MILQIDVIYLISQTCNVLEICKFDESVWKIVIADCISMQLCFPGDGGELPNCDVLLDFNDIMRTIFCVLYMHYFVKYDKNNLVSQTCYKTFFHWKEILNNVGVGQQYIM